MIEARKDAPRRYIVNGAGQRVLVGLTSSETSEFERLDNLQASLEGTSLFKEERRQERQEARLPLQSESDQRWLELYVKHERAWSVWMAESRTRLNPHALNEMVSAGKQPQRHMSGARAGGPRPLISRACCFPECSSE